MIHVCHGNIVRGLAASEGRAGCSGKVAYAIA